MRFDEFMQKQQIERRARLSADSRKRIAQRKRNGRPPTPPVPEAIVTKAKAVSCEPGEWSPPRPADDEFCARVEALLAEARARAQETLDSWRSQSPS